jgi:hypothetical protein
VLLAFAPFTLMDSHGSWRMSSVISRWSILPVRTPCLVLVPLALGWVFLGVLIAAWTPILSRMFPGIDMLYMLAVFLAGAVAAQALAWAIPRKPGQFWALAAVLFLALLLGAIVPQDSAGWPEARSLTLQTLAAVIAGLSLLAIWAARRNRCGDWSGEVPLAALCHRVRRPSNRTAVFRNPIAALFWSEIAPSCRTFILGWIGLALLLTGWACVTLWLHRPGVKIDWLLVGLGMVIDGLPNFGVLWLMAWALLLACEPGMGFQTRLSAYRSTRPLTVGMLAGTRMSSLLVTWLCVWVPLMLLQRVIPLAGLPDRDAFILSQQAADIMASRMVFSASTIVAALPLLLWGRLEGFPTVLLASLVAWCWTLVLGAFVGQRPAPDWLTWALGALLVAKMAAAAWLLLRSLRQGYLTWRFPAILSGGWVALIGGISWLFSPWQSWGLTSLLALSLMIPLVRLAACPLAMASNRHN